MATVKEYYEGLLKKAGVADDKQQAILSALDDENVAKVLNEDLLAPRLRQDDYSRNMDALKTDKQKWAQFYQDTITWKANEQDRIKQLEALAAGNGHDPNGNGNGNQTVLTTEALTALDKKYDERLKTQEQNFLSLLEGVGDITSDYVVRFKEKPDLGAIKKIAIDKQMSLTQAYNEYIAPRLQTQQQAEFDAKLKLAREEGAKDALSKHRLPVDTAPREFHPLLDRGVSDTDIPAKGPARDRWVRDQFINDLQAPTSSTSGGSTG